MLPIVANLCTKTITGENPPLLATLWLGTNDSASKQVPLDSFTSQMRAIIYTLLSRNTPRLVVITPPPLNGAVLSQSQGELSAEDNWDHYSVQAACAKLEYGKAVISLVKGLQEENNGEFKDRLIVVDVWRSMTNKALDADGKEPFPVDVEISRELLAKHQCPGSGLPGAKRFPPGWFTDAIHLGSKGYEAVNESVFTAIDAKWPDLLQSE
jgi:isoamyl acetate esterase